MDKEFIASATGQRTLCYNATHYPGRANEHFMELLRTDDITSSELQRLIERRPSLWGRYQGFVGKLQEKGK